MIASISNPQLQTNIFALLLVILLVVSIRKAKQIEFFPISQTQELKGFAILVIIFAHVGYELFSGSNFLFPFSTLAGVGVNLFLFLSGFGLAISAIKKDFSRKIFYQDRLPKLFLPLWAILIVFLILDFLILNKTYSVDEVIKSILGFFPKANVQTSINSPLWYFTVIIFYYLLFPLLFLKKYPVLSAIAIYFISIEILKLNLPIDKDLLTLYKVHNTAFPVGIIFASIIAYPNTFITRSLERLKNNRIINPLLLIALSYGIYHTSIYSGVGINLYQEQLIAMITTLMIIFFFYFKNFEIGALSFLGILSYEIYLLHWPILARYDLLYNRLPASIATLIYIFVFIILGLVLQKLINPLFKKRT